MPAGNFPRGVAVNPQTNTVAVNSTSENAVVVIDGRTNTVVTSVGVGSFPFDGIATNPRLNTVYVANQDSNTVSVLAP